MIGKAIKHMNTPARTVAVNALVAGAGGAVAMMLGSSNNSAQSRTRMMDDSMTNGSNNIESKNRKNYYDNRPEGADNRFKNFAVLQGWGSDSPLFGSNARIAKGPNKTYKPYRQFIPNHGVSAFDANGLSVLDAGVMNFKGSRNGNK